MTLKIALLADTHGHLPVMPKCDMVLHAGDICPNFNPRYVDNERIRQAAWMSSHLRPWLDSNPPVIATFGNHDFIGQRSQLIPDLSWTLLIDQKTECQGLKIYGTPWTLRFFDWAFMASEEALEGVFSMIPTGLDILLVHGPPQWVGDLDKCPNGNVGSESLAAAIKLKRPRHVVFGHVHEGRGMVEEDGITYHNVSYLNGHYQPYELEIPVIEVEI